MQAAGAHFVRNPGKGLLLDEAPERRDALRTQLNSGDRKELSRAERRQQLLTRLLSEQEPCKTAVLARALGVSESTLSADLDELETKLHPYRVEMFRRPGVGVWLQGDASSYRRVVSALLRSSMPEKELAEVLCGRMPENEIFSTLLDTKTAEKVLALTQKVIARDHLTSLMITHNMRDALRFGNRLVMMNAGRIVVDVGGEEKKRLTIPDLLNLFEKASGEELDNDRMILG